MLEFTPTQKIRDKFISKIKKDEDGCWLWTGAKNQDGYGWFNIGRPSVGAHRVSWRLFRGEIPDGMCVLHKCDRPPCVNPSHLWLGTQTENIADRTRKGRSWHSVGELCGNSKLTNSDAEYIRSIHKLKYGDVKMLAEKFKANRHTIQNVRRGVHYASA